MRSAALVLSCLLGWAAACGAGERCLAIDGDTLVCNHQKVRLTNVYAAELNQAGGPAAKRRLQFLIASGDVTLNPVGRDKYGRTLAEVYVNGRRIEQADIGPRAGRGTQWGTDRHYVRPRHVRSPIKPRPQHPPSSSPAVGVIQQWRLPDRQLELHGHRAAMLHVGH
jgi:hypothetical protein